MITAGDFKKGITIEWDGGGGPGEYLPKPGRERFSSSGPTVRRLQRRGLLDLSLIHI